MNWTISLDALVIDEPVGFNDLTIRARRDPAWHGIFFEASTSELQFYGAAADYLREKKETLGFAADVTFTAVPDCDTENPFIGKLDFRQYKERCGNTCFVILPVEQEGCTMTLRNRYDQKVDMSNSTSFNGQTILPVYNGMNFEMEMAAQESEAASDASVAAEGDTISLQYPFSNGFQADVYFRPTYGNVRNNSIQTGQLDNVVNNFQFTEDQATEPISPQLLFEDVSNCFDPPFDYNVRLKGTYNLNTTIGGQVSSIINKLIVWDGVGNLIDDGTLIDEEVIPVSGPLPNFPESGSFDSTFTGTIDIPEESALYAITFMHIATQFDPGTTDFVVVYDSDTVFTVNALQSCPPTEAVVSLIHETASHIAESITDYCLRVKSDYYGRTDSEPYAAATDGCGSLRVLTSGLRLRNADNPKHFLSLKELFDGLNAIDNIGMGVEDPFLRIEPVEYFYNDTQVLSLPYIPDATYELQDEMAYSKVLVGYKKWEIESTNGLDEFNSNKEFRSTLTSIDNTLDITSNFIAGGYPIEQTRQQSFADTGAADTKYDNDTFIVCVTRLPYAYGNDYAVEQGVIENGANMFSPATAYNWRIRPMYNLMRWWKSIAQSYVNLVNTASRFLFSAGTGNLTATGDMLSDACGVDAVTKPENGDLARTDMRTGTTPIWKPETVNIRYPMSMKDYNLVKANPYGYIYFQCGTGDYEKGYINEMLYRPAKGEVELTLKLKWE